MAKVKRALSGSSGSKLKSKIASKGKISVKLPTKPTKRSDDLRDYSILIHGEKKIGKTSFLSQEEGAFFIEFDPEQQALEIIQEQCPDWAHFKAYITELERAAKKGKLPYRTCTVDGADIMYRECFNWCCKKLVINHPHEENDFGQSWDFIRTEFGDTILRLLRIPGLATRFISHSSWKEVKSRGGGSFDKLVPNLKRQAEEVLVGQIDIWAAYCYDGKDRVLVIKGDESTGAGHRVDHRFRTPDGQMVEEIPMGHSPEQAYANFLNAWNNKQEFTTVEARRAELRAKKEKKKGGKKKSSGK